MRMYPIRALYQVAYGANNRCELFAHRALLSGRRVVVWARSTSSSNCSLVGSKCLWWHMSRMSSRVKGACPSEPHMPMAIFIMENGVGPGLPQGQ